MEGWKDERRQGKGEEGENRLFTFYVLCFTFLLLWLGLGGEATFGLWFSVGGVSAAPNLLKLTMPGELAVPHAEYEDDCKSCHETWKGVDQRKCLKCHQQLASEMEQGKGLHRGPIKAADGTDVYRWLGLKEMAGTCVQCHSDHNGREFAMIDARQFRPASFQHSVTSYPLTGKHAQVKCEACHRLLPSPNPPGPLFQRGRGEGLGVRATFLGLSQACIACHRKDVHFVHQRLRLMVRFAHRRQRLTDAGEKGHNGELGTACEKCHTTAGFRPSTFTEKQHNQLDFKLLGKHATVECARCHLNGRYKGVPTDCFSCHQKDDALTPALSAENQRRRQYEVERGEQFEAERSEAESQRMRQIEAERSEQRERVGHIGQLGKDCADCHTPDGWKPSTFTVQRHGHLTFRLEGKHASVPCAQCHLNGQYKRLETTCFGCHQKDDVKPKGHQGQLRRACESCHTITAWRPSIFTTLQHNSLTYKLEGRHADVQCAKCHINGHYKPLETTCFACHEQTDIKPGGHQGQLGKKCESCHVVQGWEPSNFTVQRHQKETKYPLEGKHIEVACQKCHTGGKYKPLDMQCVACHEQTEQTQGHRGELGVKCESCHTAHSWKISTFTVQRHQSETKYPLDGKHLNAPCAKCHVVYASKPVLTDGKYKGLDTRCVACHLSRP